MMDRVERVTQERREREEVNNNNNNNIRLFLPLLYIYATKCVRNQGGK